MFVDGCFWHACELHGTVPRANKEYWESKLLRNVERDRRDTASLKKADWTVVRIWEHEDPGDAVAIVEAALVGEEDGDCKRCGSR